VNSEAGNGTIRRCKMGPGYGGWGGWGGMWGFPWMMIVFLVVAVFCLVFIFRGLRSGRGFGCCGDDLGDRRETPLEILKRRYAAGEITPEEFQRMKKEIE
jgi:putative membrane protein